MHEHVVAGDTSVEWPARADALFQACSLRVDDPKDPRQPPQGAPEKAHSFCPMQLDKSISFEGISNNHKIVIIM